MLPRAGHSTIAHPDSASGFRSHISRYTQGFVRDESGALLIFAVYIFVIILMVAGIGIDLMHVERERAKLQYTLDRAVLAAADLDQTIDATLVVHDYFDKAGLGEYLSSVHVETGIGYKVVSATAEAEIRTQFMHMTGQDTLGAPAASTAEERIDGVEISLILDVSGSMNENNRLENLQVAATNFVDDMVNNSEEDKLSISIIPYAEQVAAPNELFDELDIPDDHGFSNCLNFEREDFNSTAISPTVEQEQTLHFDYSNSNDRRTRSPLGQLSSIVCKTTATREILVMQQDANTLKSFINDLTAGGWTSIDLGMKWGTALLDPEMRPAIANMTVGGHVPTTFADRPVDFDDNDTVKVVVLMTDGANTRQHYITENYRDGLSDVWWNDDEEVYSTYDPDKDAYFWPKFDYNNRRFENHGDGVWADHPFGQDGPGCIRRYWGSGSWNCSNRNWNGEAVQLKYADLWASTSLKYNLYYNYRTWMNSSSEANDKWYYDVYDRLLGPEKDTRTKAVCDAAKDKNIIVYTIGFKAQPAGQAVLADCASSPSYYFEVDDGNELIGAFSAIASSIRKLRLTQ